MEDKYRTIAEASHAEFKEKGSKFLAYATPMDSEEEFYQYYSQIKEEHFKARHHCFAFELGMDGNLFRANDDGEPSGTAGRPIHGQIRSAALTNVGVIVVRYFGGTKLGVPGLIHAYKTSAADCLQVAHIIEKYIYDKFILNFEFEKIGIVMAALKNEDIEITLKNFDVAPTVEISIRQGMSINKIFALKSRLLNISLDSITDKTIVPFCKIVNK